MGISLRDQLVKAGLAGKQKADALNAKSRKKHRHPATVEPDCSAAQQAARAKRDRDKALNAAVEEKRQKAAIKGQIKVLIEGHPLRDYNGEVVYHYVFGSKVRQLYLKQSIYDQLSSDRLAITRLNGKTYLIPIATAEKVLALNPAWALVRPGAAREKSRIDKDSYADYPVPDDLIW